MYFHKGVCVRAVTAGLKETAIHEEDKIAFSSLVPSANQDLVRALWDLALASHLGTRWDKVEACSLCIFVRPRGTLLSTLFFKQYIHVFKDDHLAMALSQARERMTS